MARICRIIPLKYLKARGVLDRARERVARVRAGAGHDGQS